MFDDNSYIYPLLGVVLALIGAFLIRQNFHSEKTLPDYRRKQIGHDEKLRAGYVNGRSIFFILTFSALLIYATWQIWSVSNGYVFGYKPFFITFGLLFIGQLLLATFAKPFEIKNSHDTIHKFKTAIIVPVYNESENSLKEGIQSFFDQTVLPNEIHIVDDGSDHNYEKTKKWFIRKSKKMGIVASWQKQNNSGKRLAHDKAIEAITYAENTIIVTIDSDGVLDPNAIEEGLKPFTDPRVQSVAGVVIAKNAQVNLLSRITDLIFVSSQQLIDRSAMSQLGSVLVNSGGLAFYRSSIIYKALKNGYTSEVFFNRDIHYSDDSYLTLFALLDGRAVQQQSSIVFADMPVTLSHHVRQQIRWGRGSFIRSWWRLRYLSVNSVAYLRQLIGWIIFVCLTVIFVDLLIFTPITTGSFPPPQLLIVPFIFGFLQYSRYFSIRRSDMSTGSQVASFLLAPIARPYGLLL